MLEIVTSAPARSIRAVEICDAEALWDGEMKSFVVGGAMTILLLKSNGRFHAYQGTCPHQGAALDQGEFDGGLITCAAHRWQFDATDGRGVNPRSACLKRFPVRIVDRKVLVELEFVPADGQIRRR
jgi:nitrite reductase/ring-hydroxylating ferredoxin subunit